MNSPKKKTRAIFVAAIVTLLANYAISSTATTPSSYVKTSSGLQEARGGSSVVSSAPRPSSK